MPRFRLQHCLGSRTAARDEIGMAPDIFRKRSDSDIRTERQGRLIERAEKRIIDNERQFAAISGQMLSEDMGAAAISTMPFVGLAGVST